MTDTDTVEMLRGVPGEEPGTRPFQLSRVLVTTFTDGADVSVGRDERGKYWVYSIETKRAAGVVDSPANLLSDPTAPEGAVALTFVVAGLLSLGDKSQWVAIQLGDFQQKCRVHENVWVSTSVPFEPNGQLNLRWTSADGIELDSLILPPLDRAMLGGETIGHFGT